MPAIALGWLVERDAPSQILPHSAFVEVGERLDPRIAVGSSMREARGGHHATQGHRMHYAPLVYLAAAVAEIAGCFGFWAWLRLGKSSWWLVPAVASLIAFASLLTLIQTPSAGRAFAAYGGVYIVASLGWLWLAESMRPDRWDLAGATVCLIGAGIILAAPR